MNDPYNLARFVAAQAGSYAAALSEIRDGAKRSHWMWYVFPQLAGLGRSDIARYFSITSLAEAQAYLAHPLLGARLRECITALAAVEGRTARQIFGEVDAMKLRSSLTLFSRVEPGTLFTQAIAYWFAGQADPATLAMLDQMVRGDSSG